MVFWPLQLGLSNKQHLRPHNFAQHLANPSTAGLCLLQFNQTYYYFSTAWQCHFVVFLPTQACDDFHAIKWAILSMFGPSIWQQVFAGVK